MQIYEEKWRYYIIIYVFKGGILLEIERKKAALVKAGYYLLFAIAGYTVMRYIWPLLIPFILGFAVAYMLRPATVFICRHSKISRRGAAITCAIIFYVVLAGAVWIVALILFLQAERIGAWFPSLYFEHIEPALALVNDKILAMARRFSPKVNGGEIYSVINDALGNAFVSASNWGMSIIAGWAKSIPAAVITLIFTILSSVLICSGYDQTTGFVMRQIPQRLHKTVLDVRDFLAKTIFKILKTYLIIMVITFVLLASGMWFLKIEGFVAYSALIAFLDLLPVIGSGAVLVPWGVILIVIGDSFTGIGLLLLWAIISFVREIIEPKILGSQIGLHPLATLTSMYIGLRLAGFGGLILAPIICMLTCHLHDEGIINLYK